MKGKAYYQYLFSRDFPVPKYAVGEPVILRAFSIDLFTGTVIDYDIAHARGVPELIYVVQVDDAKGVKIKDILTNNDRQITGSSYRVRWSASGFGSNLIGYWFYASEILGSTKTGVVKTYTPDTQQELF